MPRYAWPAAWTALTSHKAPFTTGVCVPACPGRGGAVEVNVRDGGAAIVERFGARFVGSAKRDPWAAMLRAGALAHLKDAGPDDPLEAAFRREAEKARRRAEAAA